MLPLGHPEICCSNFRNGINFWTSSSKLQVVKVNIIIEICLKKSPLSLSVSPPGLKCLGDQVWTFVRTKKHSNWRTNQPPRVHANTEHTHACVYTSSWKRAAAWHIDQNFHVKWCSHTHQYLKTEQLCLHQRQPPFHTLMHIHTHAYKPLLFDS